jgi:hypothetical protein
MKAMGIPLTGRGIGLTDNTGNNVKTIARKIHELSSGFAAKGRKF